MPSRVCRLCQRPAHPALAEDDVEDKVHPLEIIWDDVPYSFALPTSDLERLFRGPAFQQAPPNYPSID
jgi:hypothetical protein